MESGQTIAGKYRLNRPIGTGGMATVWSATNIFTEREFAIKFMLPQVARTPEAARRFLLEAKISARINHPNIIEVIDVGQAEDGSLFLVMELLTGQSLETAIRRQVPPMLVKDFARVMLDVAKALAAAHRSGVIHRDLKPTNVFLHKDRDGVVVPKILDFGVSKILEDEHNNALTVAGTVLGSPLYMSPEQASGAANIDHRTDIFAFGSILFEALTGNRAYDAHNFNALIVTIATTQPKKIDDVAPQVPESLRSIVRDCMVTDKNKRIASLDRVAERLARALPELEKLTMRLPSPYTQAPPSDPDATNALPVISSSAKLPLPSSASLESTGPRGSVPAPKGSSADAWGNSPPGAFSAPWSAHGPAAKKAPPTWLYAAGGGAFLLVALAVLITIVATRGGGTSTAAGHPSAATSMAALAPTASASAPAAPTTPPEVNVDALPQANRGKSKVKTGQLSIEASPGTCAVSVDGTKVGSTPIAPIDLSAGVHRVECAVPNGAQRAANVLVPEGGLEKYKFVLDE